MNITIENKKQKALDNSSPYIVFSLSGRSLAERTPCSQGIVRYTSSRQTTLRCFRVSPKIKFASLPLLFPKNLALQSFSGDLLGRLAILEALSA